jgi:hypothetical protein
MPKIRGVKPTTWTDGKFVSLSPLARLLFMGMWTEACDNGHVEDNLSQLKIRLLPMDDCDIADVLAELLASGQVVRVGGCLKVVNLAEHQKPDRRFLTLCEHCAHDEQARYSDADKLPHPAGARRAHAVHTTGTRRAHGDDGEGEGEGEGDNSPSVSGPRKRGTRLPEGWLPEPNVRSQMAAERADVDLVAEHAKFCDHWRAQPGQKGVKLDWAATWRNWMRNARPHQPRPSPGLDLDAAMARAQARDAQRELSA